MDVDRFGQSGDGERRMGGDGFIMGRDGNVVFSAKELEAPILKVMLERAQTVLDFIHDRDPRVKGLLMGIPSDAFKRLTAGLEDMLPKHLGEFMVGRDSPVINEDLVAEMAPEIPPMLGVLVRDCPLKEEPAYGHLRGAYGRVFKAAFPDHFIDVHAPDRQDDFLATVQGICPEDELVVIQPEDREKAPKAADGKEITKVFLLKPKNLEE